ncbi:MAG: hypothetical protein ABIR83_16425 [Nakamurella sp.]
MQNRLLIGAAVAASLVLTACGGAASGTGTTSPAETSGRTDSSGVHTANSSSSDTGPRVEPAVLDEQTASWFRTFCGSITDIGASATAVTAGVQSADSTKTPAELQAAFGGAVSDFGTRFRAAAGMIGAAPAPTIDGGADLANGTISAFSGVGDTMTAAADTFKATPVTDAASFTAAAAALQTDVQAGLVSIQEALKPLQTVLTPEIQAAVTEIPGCKGLTGP